jgi:hypothetical protein
MVDLLIGCIMSPLGSRNFALPVLQKLLIHPPFSIFVGLIGNDIPVDEREYRHKIMKGGLEIPGLLRNQTTLSWCNVVGFSRNTITLPHHTVMFFNFIFPEGNVSQRRLLFFCRRGGFRICFPRTCIITLL